MTDSLYDTDFYAWTSLTAEKLRRSRFDEIDILTLAEEVEDLGKSTRRALENRMAVLLAHLLKWEYQPGERSRSWQATVREQQRRVKKLLAENPSLESWLSDNLPDVYESAVNIAVSDTGMDEAVFPEHCPFTVREALATRLSL
jgi:hypothetical protein